MKKKTNKVKVSKNPSKALITRMPKDEIIAMVLDKKEDELIKSELAGAMVDKLGYRVMVDYVDKNTGKKVNYVKMQDLTYIGYRELARAVLGGRVKFGEPKETYMAEEQLWAVRIECTNIDTGENAWGGAEVSAKFQSGERNAFPYRQAIVKAQRNALKQLIPLQDKMKMLQTWLKLKSEQFIDVPVDTASVNKMLPAVEENKRKLSAIFASINELKLPAEQMHQHLRNSYKVEHLRSLPVEKMNEIIKRLKEYKSNESLRCDLLESLKEVKVKAEAI
jgi:hypothetical protein